MNKICKCDKWLDRTAMFFALVGLVASFLFGIKIIKSENIMILIIIPSIAIGCICLLILVGRERRRLHKEEG